MINTPKGLNIWNHTYIETKYGSERASYIGLLEDEPVRSSVFEKLNTLTKILIPVLLVVTGIKLWELLTILGVL